MPDNSWWHEHLPLPLTFHPLKQQLSISLSCNFHWAKVLYMPPSSNKLTPLNMLLAFVSMFYSRCKIWFERTDAHNRRSTLNIKAPMLQHCNAMSVLPLEAWTCTHHAAVHGACERARTSDRKHPRQPQYLKLYRPPFFLLCLSLFRSLRWTGAWVIDSRAFISPSECK